MKVPWQLHDIAVCAGVALLAYGIGRLASSPFTPDPHTVGMIGGVVSLVPVMAVLSRRRLREDEISRYDDVFE